MPHPLMPHRTIQAKSTAQARNTIGKQWKRCALGASGACLLLFTACSDPAVENDDQGTSGGSTGAAPGSGGSPTGGSNGTTGGATSSGGSNSSGGSGATGGAFGSGGGPGGNGAGGLSSTGGALSESGGAPGAGGTEATGGGSGEGSGGADPGSGGSTNNCPEEPQLSGGTQYCSNSKGNAGGGYGYELWADGGGSGCMTVYGVEANFGASWEGVDDFLARVGLDYDQTQTHRQIGTISAEFAETKEDDGGLTYIGIYGWTVNPLREFYILDDWGQEKPGGFSSDGTPRDEVGTLEADGETYDVWKKTRVDKPAITGPSETFDQYFSIRRTARSCGTISVSRHFEQWEELGLSLGNFHEVKLLLEAQFNSGSIEFTTAKFVVE